MQSPKVTAFLPCRAGSQRVPQKNTRSFSGNRGGLVDIKMRQLVNSSCIDEIIVSTDDPVVAQCASDYAERFTKPIQIYKRPAHLASSSTSTDELIQHVATLIDDGIILWTHVTSPFLDAHIYDDAISTFFTAYGNGSYDSLMSVTKIQSFIWDHKNPLNYDRNVEKWPRTQTLPIWYEINSAIFIAPATTYRELGDRIGRTPLLYPLEFPATLDIDDQEQFELAEQVWQSRIGK